MYSFDLIKNALCILLRKCFPRQRQIKLNENFRNFKAVLDVAIANRNTKEKSKKKKFKKKKYILIRKELRRSVNTSHFLAIFAILIANYLNFVNAAKLLNNFEENENSNSLLRTSSLDVDVDAELRSFEETQQQQRQQQQLNIHLNNENQKIQLRKRRRRRQTDDDNGDATSNPVSINGIRVEGGHCETSDGVPNVLVDTDYKIRIFGTGIGKDTILAFTTAENSEKGSCLKPDTELFRPADVSNDGRTATFNVKFPHESTYYICAKNDIDDEEEDKLATDTKPLEHQGDNAWTKIKTHESLLPVWAAIIVIIICLFFSALFSGLNLGLMSLDRTELKILRNTGTPNERKHAAKIQPVRDQGNFLLCSILLGNVLVNSTFTILLDSLTSGLVAIVCSTFAIVIFGEITPQAICSRHGLSVGAQTIYITKTVMALTAPLSYPISKILDRVLGEEIGNVYNRERLKELLRVTTGITDLDKNEVKIISGALELRKKTVGDIMTHLDDVFMLSMDAILDFETVSEIMKSGYSRIPVYDGERKNIVTLLYIKDLAFVDTDDNTPLRTLCEFYQNPVYFVFEDYTLDVMFSEFKDGNIGHLAFVHRVNNEGDGEAFYEAVGLVTLEDVIEELIQAEIVDEFDAFVDNRTKIRRNRRVQDFSSFAHKPQGIRVSPQLTLATFQYLSTSVDAFKSEAISEQILRRLLDQDVFHAIKVKGKNKGDPALVIYTQGVAADYFVLILEGRVEVTIGKESLLFESGPFTYFGTQALSHNVNAESPVSLRDSVHSLNMDTTMRQTFIPDYSVHATTDVLYIIIKRSLYLTAKKATLLEKSQRTGSYTAAMEDVDVDDDEMKRLLVTDDRKQRLSSITRPSRTGTIQPLRRNNISQNENTTTNSQNPEIPENYQSPNAASEHVSIRNVATSGIAVSLLSDESDEIVESAASSLQLANKENKDSGKQQEQPKPK